MIIWFFKRISWSLNIVLRWISLMFPVSTPAVIHIIKQLNRRILFILLPSLRRRSIRVTYRWRRREILLTKYRRYDMASFHFFVNQTLAWAMLSILIIFYWHYWQKFSELCSQHHMITILFLKIFKNPQLDIVTYRSFILFGLSHTNFGI